MYLSACFSVSVIAYYSDVAQCDLVKQPSWPQTAVNPLPTYQHHDTTEILSSPGVAQASHQQSE